MHEAREREKQHTVHKRLRGKTVQRRWKNKDLYMCTCIKAVERHFIWAAAKETMESTNKKHK